jgi:two-component system, NarL family, response regulator DevR
VGLPDGSGVDLCREITRLYPHIRTVILSAYADSDTIYSAVEAGAAGFVAKGSGLDEVMRAIEAPREEPLVLEPELVLRLMQAVRARSDEFPRLSAREDELLGLLGEGLSNREIAERLSLSSGTVRNYVSALLRKLGVENRTQAALLADGARRDEGRGTI